MPAGNFVRVRATVEDSNDATRRVKPLRDPLIVGDYPFLPLDDCQSFRPA